MKDVFKYVSLVIFVAFSNNINAFCSYAGFDINNTNNQLTIPESEARYPLVIISPGGRNGGSLKGYKSWINFYKKKGIATLFIDSIKSHNCNKVGRWEDGDEFRQKDLKSALIAIKNIDSIDTNNIFIQGHSAGSSMSMTASKGLISDNGIRGAFTLYPAVYACEEWGKLEDKIPSLVFIGEKDMPLVRCWKSIGSPNYIEIEDAVHTYDLKFKERCHSTRFKNFGQLDQCYKHNAKGLAKTRKMILGFINENRQ